MQVGLVGEAVRTVAPSMLASAVGSGSLDVLATPALIALMEEAACQAVAAYLGSDQTTVGTRIEVRHLAPTPPGVEVRARAEVVEVDGRRLTFRVEAFDPTEKIGEGTHERALVDPVRLLARAAAKPSTANWLP
jgi:predicted thioesterase